MPKIDVTAVPVRLGTGYPAQFNVPCAARTRRRLGDAGGLGDFGVNLMTLPPGGWSSQRHWHTHEDEFVYVLEGQMRLFLQEPKEEVRLKPGEVYVVKPTRPHLVTNAGATSLTFLVLQGVGEYDFVPLASRQAEPS